MADILLDANHDIVITDDLVLVDGLDAIAQNCEISFKTFLGEWFLNLDVGMPYYERLLGQKPRESVVKKLFTDALMLVSGILSVDNMTFIYDGSTRHLELSFTATTTEGILTFNKEFIIL